MPENRIGFFTDVGASYVLPRLPGEIGTYMSLTGARLTGADAVQAGLATHLVPVDRLGEIPDLIARALLHRAPWGAVDGLLDRLAIARDAATIRQQQPEIDRCFGHDTVEEVLVALQTEDSDWSRHAAGVLAQQCPTSLKVTLKAMRRGARASFGRCMAMEYGICQTLIARPDFAEGVRAQLVDKCRQPAWQPATLAEVSDEVVARCFARRRAVHPEPREGLHAGAGIPTEIGTATAVRTEAPLPETA
ncbi:hypothetical protein CKO28_01680 [Rhodovibrio sodomensis]|uniref:3-hydroxyisobutyryl-CoA hydrolase n=1 Tax=Rhodovibrio sodomensis TaxID=1088 RepID=A0ABS1DAX4_9PROT|nr:enoyl-CoA hydratase/isomerase family protein [Rhodovibrio sodomensis]MBK1666753.1 hypothetical protein [Rhodovibrio sodomensis]